MPIYMKIDGVDGSVTAQGHEKWIELESCQMGVNRNITSAAGRGTNREASIPSMSEIVVTKYQDCSSTQLWKLACWGEGKQVKIDFCKTDNNKWELIQGIILENTLLSSYNISSHGGDLHSRPMESLSLNFTKITYNTMKMDDKNATAKPDRAMWDLQLGKGA